MLWGRGGGVNLVVVGALVEGRERVEEMQSEKGGGKGTYLRGVDAVFGATGGSGGEGAGMGMREEGGKPARLSQ